MVELARHPALSFFIYAVATLGSSDFLISLIDLPGEKPPPVGMLLGAPAMLVGDSN